MAEQIYKKYKLFIFLLIKLYLLLIIVKKWKNNVMFNLTDNLQKDFRILM